MEEGQLLVLLSAMKLETEAMFGGPGVRICFLGFRFPYS